MDSDSFRCRTVGWRALFADTSKSGENTRLQSESSNQNRTTSPNNQISPKPQRQKQGGLWPQVWPQKQVLRNRAALSALQKVATKHLQSPHAPHHTHITVSNHRTAGQPRAPFVVTSEEQRKSKKSSADMYCFPEEVDFRAE